MTKKQTKQKMLDLLDEIANTPYIKWKRVKKLLYKAAKLHKQLCKTK